MVSFLWPLALLMMPLPLLALRGRPDEDSAANALPIPPRLADALDPLKNRGPRTKKLPLMLLWLVWICLVTALAQPQWPLGREIQTASGRSVMLVIDLSGSMENKDFLLDGRQMDRLEVVKSVAGQFIQQRAGDRIGLVLFGDEAFVASPLSFDLSATGHALAESEIGMAGRTTALGDALGLALKKMNQDSSGEKAVILLTDGSNNAGTADPLSAAELAKHWGIRVHTIGLGSRQLQVGIRGQDPSAQLDIEALKAIASLSGGQFFRAETSEDLNSIYAQLDRMESGEYPAPPLRLKQDIRDYFLLAALLLLMFGIGLRLDFGRRTT